MCRDITFYTYYCYVTISLNHITCHIQALSKQAQVVVCG